MVGMKIKIWGAGIVKNLCENCYLKGSCNKECIDETSSKHSEIPVHVCNLDHSDIVYKAGDCESKEGVYIARCRICGRQWKGRIINYSDC